MPTRPLSRRLFLALSGAFAARAAAGKDAAAPTTDNGVAAGNTQFAVDLYGKLAAEKGNVFCSPFSVSTALGMTAAGAKGDTLAEFGKVLHLPADPAAAHAGFADIMGKLNGGPADKRPYELNTANALWAQAGYPWRAEFVKVATAQYAAGVENVDYRNPEAARGTINQWVEKRTHDKIKDLIPKGAVTPDTRLVLTNAIYFKGEWLSTFKKEDTTDQPFKLADGTTVKVPLMHQEKTFNYAEAPGVQVLELPYKGNELSMVVALPEKPDGLAKLEAGLTADSFAGWAKAARPLMVRTELPRFKVEASYTLNDPLKALGLTRAFDERKADFSGMHTGAEQFFISLVVHKAFVDVTEKGTEAAAATGVVMMTMAAMIPREEPKVFRADRPFLFAIKHNPTGSVLFLGRVTNPKG